MLRSWGVDVRLHAPPFHLPSSARPHSLVIWQRPLPESWQRQLETLRWIRDQGSLLLTEWDDHPDLFPEQIRNQLNATHAAALKCCHLIHTSSTTLGQVLHQHNPYNVVVENATSWIPELNLDKHLQASSARIFIGNQNRESDHQLLVEGLLQWCERDPSIRLVIVQDQKLAKALPTEQVQFHRTCPYPRFRKLMSSCHLALLPPVDPRQMLAKLQSNGWEAAAESVVCIGGPELTRLPSTRRKRDLGTGFAIHGEGGRAAMARAQPPLQIATGPIDGCINTTLLTMSCRYRLWLYQQTAVADTDRPAAAGASSSSHRQTLSAMSDVTLDKIRRLENQGRLKEALMTLEAELKQIHGNVAWWKHCISWVDFSIGWGLLKEAARNYQKALDLAPDRLSTLNNLAALLISSHSLDSAREVLDAAWANIARVPTNRAGNC